LTANGDGRQTGERHTSKHVINAEHVAVIVEERLRAGRQIHGSEHHPDPAGIDAVEINYFTYEDAQCRC
jgi:hypothetical protein